MSRPSRKQLLQQKKALALKLSGRDKFLICLIIAALVALSLAFEHKVATSRQAESLDRQIARWRTQFHLNAEQERLIRRIEREFHGSGSPFARRPNPSEPDVSEHQRAIARIMNPEDGARFLAPQQGKLHSGH